MTAALLDRLTHRAHMLDFVGESYRFRQRFQQDEQEKREESEKGGIAEGHSLSCEIYKKR